MPTAGKPVLLFDLGGVLLDFAGFEAMHELTGGRYSLEEVRRKWAVSPALQAFEQGRTAPAVFAGAMVREWGLDLAPDDFLERFRTWPRAFYDGAEALLRDLRPAFTVGCLSNTNPAHWERMRAMIDIGAAFDHCFLSFEMGLGKPDPAIFRRTGDLLGVPPGAIAFFDDAAVNVEAARSCGWHAYRTRGLGEVRAALAQAGAAIRPD